MNPFTIEISAPELIRFQDLPEHIKTGVAGRMATEAGIPNALQLLSLLISVDPWIQRRYLEQPGIMRIPFYLVDDQSIHELAHALAVHFPEHCKKPADNAN